MAEHQSDAESHSVSRWATGGIAFAATVMILIGVFQVTAGLTAIFNDAFYVTTRNYTFGLDVTAWGWIDLIIGFFLVVTALALFARRAWAGVVAIILAVVSAIQNFFFIPYYPFWALLVIALDVFVMGPDPAVRDEDLVVRRRSLG